MGKKLQALLGSAEVKGLAKVHKGAMIQKASEAETKRGVFLSTGNYVLDSRLGGGLRPGRFHTFYGPPSSGKTHAVLTAGAHAQKCCANCWKHRELCECAAGPEEVLWLHIVTEDWDEDWARTLGIDLEELALIRPAYGEEALDEIDVLMRTGKVDLITLDSLAMLTPAAEIKESVAKDHMGVSARMISLAIRKIQAGLQGLAREGIMPTILITNQVRMDLSVMFGNPETKPGGKAAMFAATTETRFSPCKDKYSTELRRTVLSECKVKVKKNKQWEPGHMGEYSILFQPTKNKPRGSVADEAAILSDLRHFEVATKEKGKWQILDREFKNLEQITEGLESDPEFKRDVIEVLISIRRA